ncbi:MAG: hypothetical protein ACPGWR_12400 [Ardenticatenaceae bacterium]
MRPTLIGRPNGALPADLFFDVWADLQREERTVQLNARLVDGRLELLIPQKSLIRTENNHIYLEDGRELVIQLET